MGFGFTRVEITPLLGPLQWASGTLVHPFGQIEVRFDRQEGGLSGTVSLPAGVDGVLRYAGKVCDLVPGFQQVKIP